jgi:hypothetical protein
VSLVCVLVWLVVLFYGDVGWLVGVLNSLMAMWDCEVLESNRPQLVPHTEKQILMEWGQKSDETH